MSNPNDLLYSVVRHLIRVTPYGTESEHDVLVRALEIAATAAGATIDPNLDSISREVESLTPKAVVEETSAVPYSTPVDDAPAVNATAQAVDAPAAGTTTVASEEVTAAADGVNA